MGILDMGNIFRTLINFRLKSFMVLLFWIGCQQNGYSFDKVEDFDSDSSIRHRYDQSLETISVLLDQNGSFKLAVFEVESAFYPNKSDQTLFYKSIDQLARLCQALANTKKNSEIINADSLNFLLNYSIFSAVHDTLYIFSDSLYLGHKPYRYNFEDPDGTADWSNTFVSRLLLTHTGNCRSLSYLYKIIADELHAKCWLALAPNHIYIRNYSSKIGWYNTELSSGVFPTDAWIAMTGYISTDAIRSGVYMDTLSNQQSIALCALDLGKGYELQTHNYYDGFILKCCDLALKYFSVNPQALLLKAETLQKLYLRQKRGGKTGAAATYEEMEKTYITLAKLGNREMPEKMYKQWLQTLAREKEKYSDKRISISGK